MTIRKLALSAACGMCAGLLVGCGPSAEGAKYAKGAPVRGTVKFADGTPVVEAEVEFWPNVDPKAEAMTNQPFVGSGFTDDRGSYKAGLGASDSGLVPGQYTVVASPKVNAKPSSNSKNIDEKFRSREKSTLKVDVKDTDNTIDIVLK